MCLNISEHKEEDEKDKNQSKPQLIIFLPKCFYDCKGYKNHPQKF